ncbi:MAG: G5 domain-containing protein [bacterium]|nr:G5 domain-containing protein [bacterium]
MIASFAVLFFVNRGKQPDLVAGKGFVLGAVAASDSNHPQETYMGSDRYRKIGDMLDALQVTVYPEDKVKLFPDPELGMGSIISIHRATPVIVYDGNEQVNYRTWAGTVGGLFQEKSIEVGDKDLVNPSLATNISNSLVVKIIRVTESQITENTKISFKTIYENDPSLDKGKSKVKTAGVNGLRECIYQIRRENGKLVSKDLISDKIIKEVVDAVVIRGTKVLTANVATGVASYYVRTSRMIGACNLVPKGTRLRVTNLANGKSIEVTSSGGGLRGDRVIDLSTGAFEALGVPLSQGLIPRVRVEKVL